jgi:hypothetical protein
MLNWMKENYVGDVSRYGEKPEIVIDATKMTKEDLKALMTLAEQVDLGPIFLQSSDPNVRLDFKRMMKVIPIYKQLNPEADERSKG